MILNFADDKSNSTPDLPEATEPDANYKVGRDGWMRRLNENDGRVSSETRWARQGASIQGAWHRLRCRLRFGGWCIDGLANSACHGNCNCVYRRDGYRAILLEIERAADRREQVGLNVLQLARLVVRNNDS